MRSASGVVGMAGIELGKTRSYTNTEDLTYMLIEAREHFGDRSFCDSAFNQDLHDRIAKHTVGAFRYACCHLHSFTCYSRKESSRAIIAPRKSGATDTPVVS